MNVTAKPLVLPTLNGTIRTIRIAADDEDQFPVVYVDAELPWVEFAEWRLTCGRAEAAAWFRAVAVAIESVE